MDQEGIYGCQRYRERIRFWSLSWQVDKDCVCKVDGETEENIESSGCMPTFVLFVRDGPFLDLDELVPFLSSSFVQETLWYPRQEICRIHCLLQAMMRYLW